MTTTKPLVIVTRKLPDAIETRMMELFEVRLNLDDTPMSRAEIAAAMQEADVLVPTVTDRIHASLINEAGDQLKLIATFGTGVDNIDLDAANKRYVRAKRSAGPGRVDSNKDGKLSPREFAKGLESALGVSSTEAWDMVDAMMPRMDIDGDGNLSYKEFLNTFRMSAVTNKLQDKMRRA